MLITNESYFEELHKRLKKNPTSIRISTFGLYAGILDTGKNMHKIGGKYTSNAHLLLDAFCAEKIPVQILVGIAPYRSCKAEGHCEDCYRAYGKQIVRLLKHAENWPECEWRFKADLHLKCVIFNYFDSAKDCAFGGGRNFTDSNWADISFELSKDLTEPMQKYFIEQWAEASPITEEKLTDYVVTSFENKFITD